MLVKVGIPACRKMVGLHPYHCVGEKYLLALTQTVGAVPLLLPGLGSQVAISDYLDNIDGLLLTGSYSNVEPHHYGQNQQVEDGMIDPARDDLTLNLIREAVARDLPVLGICRGFQEIIVAFGGSLHQKVHATGRHQDHREDKNLTLDEQYDLSHPITLQPGGILAGVWPEPEVMVNSLHGQGADQLGDQLHIEATAPDGLVEAVSLPGKALLGVQWHPEWKVLENPFYQSIFAWFKQAIINQKLKSHD